MLVNRDFPSLFDTDNFRSRRTTGHNLYDPESLLTGAEIAAGFTYNNSARDWYSQADYLAACVGLLTHEQIIRRAPRISLADSRAARLLQRHIQRRNGKKEPHHA